MPRRRLCRRVAAIPAATGFRPQGAVGDAPPEVVLPVEGLEALRLADLEGLTADGAAQLMGVSRHTFGRVLAEARATVARALVEGLALRIEGGDYRLADEGLGAPDANRQPCGDLSPDSAAASPQKEQAMFGRGNRGGGGGGQGQRCGQGGGRGQGAGQGRGGAGRCQGQVQGQGQGQGQGSGRGQGLGRGGVNRQGAAMPQVAADAGRCPNCGGSLIAAAGQLPEICPTCGGAVGTPAR